MPDPRVTIEAASLDAADAVTLIRELDADLRVRYPGVALHGLRADEITTRRLTLLIARADGHAAGCGALRRLDQRVGEIKRVFVRTAWRRRGIARRLLEALESTAREQGYASVRLETAPAQPEALALYQSAGYARIPPFGEYMGNPVSICFEKRLPPLP